ncbi:MAG TPA: alpha-amylase family glycosyl hydrolase [Gemmatimonadaceae bacterium]|nr:alpha-amylase family glycosyl hydrolase [Gemmatimonadaceae bacterium]
MRRCAASVLAILAAACSSTTLSTAAGGLPKNTTQWWRDGVCYEVFVRSFVDADGDGIGDLRGLTARLDYINDGNPASTTSLGANCIWLMPIDKAVSYHGYDVTDYYHVDPHYGSDDDFRNLVSEAHRRGIHVIVDFVPNHSSSEHPYFQAALHDPASQYRSWYRWSSTNPNQPGPWGQVAWHKSPVRDEYYYGVFWDGMPDLNYGTPAVLQEMQKVAAYWLKDMHADGFRFDAIPYLVEEGPELQHTRGTHDVLRQFGNTIRSEAPGSFTIGEVSDWSTQILATYYPDQLDSYFAFGVAGATLEAAHTGNAAPFNQAIWEANVTFPPGRWSPFLTNHDQPRVMTVLGGDAARARVAAGAMLMLPGLPFVYYGEEIGMIGAKPDETIRTPMQWSAESNGGFTNGTAWESLQPDWMTKNVAAQDHDPGSLLNHYRRLIHFRNAHAALSDGALSIASANDSASAAFVRSTSTETILIALNFGDHGIDRFGITLSPAVAGSGWNRLEPLYADPLDGCVGGAISADGKSVTLSSIAAHGLCVFRLRRD